MTNVKMNFKKVVIGFVGATAVLVGAAFYLMYPSQYLALDVNPSIEFQTNRMGRVVSMVGVNEDARKLLTDYEADGKKLDVVLEQVVDLMVESGYIAEGQINDILITSEEGTASQKTLLKVSEKVKGELVKHELSGEIVTQSIKLDKEMTENAAKNQVSAGKMAVIAKLTNHDVSLTAEDLAHTRISDLLLYAKENKISLDTLENHLEALQDQGGENQNLEELEEGIEDAQDVEEDAEDAAEDAADAAKDAAEEAEDAAEEARDLAEEKAEKEADAIEEANDAIKDAEDKAKDLAEEEAEKLEEAQEAKERAQEKDQDTEDEAEDNGDLAED